MIDQDQQRDYAEEAYNRDLMHEVDADSTEDVCAGCGSGPHVGFGVGEIVRNRETGRLAEVFIANPGHDCPRTYLVHYDGDAEGERFWGTDATFEHFGEQKPEILATREQLVGIVDSLVASVIAINKMARELREELLLARQATWNLRRVLVAERDDWREIAEKSTTDPAYRLAKAHLAGLVYAIQQLDSARTIDPHHLAD